MLKLVKLYGFIVGSQRRYFESLFATYFLQCWSNWGCRNEREQSQATTRATLQKNEAQRWKRFKIVRDPQVKRMQRILLYYENVTADFGKRFASVNKKQKGSGLPLTVAKVNGRSDPVPIKSLFLTFQL